MNRSTSTIMRYAAPLEKKVAPAVLADDARERRDDEAPDARPVAAARLLGALGLRVERSADQHVLHPALERLAQGVGPLVVEVEADAAEGVESVVHPSGVPGSRRRAAPT